MGVGKRLGGRAGALKRRFVTMGTGGGYGAFRATKGTAMKLLSMMAVTAGLSACATTADPQGERRMSYACERGPEMTVVYTGDTARIVDADGGEELTLPRRPAGSGFLYETARHSIRGKGDEIVYTVGRMAPMRCKAR